MVGGTLRAVGDVLGALTGTKRKKQASQGEESTKDRDTGGGGLLKTGAETITGFLPLFR